MYADVALKGRKNLIAGANKEDFHLKKRNSWRDFGVTEYADLPQCQRGEGWPQFGAPLKVAKAVEIGHIFKLGYKYSESMAPRPRP